MRGERRTPKVRAWIKSDKRMVYEDEIKGIYYNSIIGKLEKIDIVVYDVFDDRIWHTESRKDFVLTNYTHFKDKYGNEIYEDDIVKYNNSIFIIKNKQICIMKYREKGFCLEWVGISQNKNVLCLRDFNKKCKIIGNVYENPELLKKVV